MTDQIKSIVHNTLNSSVMRNEVDRVVKNFPKKQSPSPDGFIAEFHKTFKVYHQCSSMHSKKKNYLGKEYYQSHSAKPKLS
jgi:hypothetical protein